METEKMETGKMETGKMETEEIELNIENVSKFPLTYTVSADEKGRYEEFELGDDSKNEKKFFEIFQHVTLHQNGNLYAVQGNNESITLEYGEPYSESEWMKIRALSKYVGE